ncbi:MAG: phosphate propanoyltransferase [Erysipelotrichaceae bacterium]|nr:phosphate propanoyltransferase [Erysipelotrichaceae bacterium]MDD4643398.1 phosphate propanoyltransferase [Erysipelotrichaceae bacterium]
MKKVLVEISARHMHLSEEHLAVLFGEGYKLTPKKNLSQPGQFACEEKVTVVGSRSQMAMTILGPTRKESQVEISLTDARTLGIDAKIRESGHIEDTNGCKLVGPKGEVTLDKGVIVAKRHIHLTQEDANELGVKDSEIVSVKIETPDRTTTYGDVVIRIRNDFAAAMHIDTDEGNAAGIMKTAYGEIVR